MVGGPRALVRGRTVGKVKELYEREEIAMVHLPDSEPPASLVLLEGPPPSLTGREKIDRLKVHFHLPSDYDDGTVLATLEQYLGIRNAEGRPTDQRRDEVFKQTYRTSVCRRASDRRPWPPTESLLRARSAVRSEGPGQHRM